MIGIDHSPEMLEHVRRKAEDAGVIARIELRNEDILDSPLPEGSADVVTCQGVLHHVNDLGACVRALGRVLRPRGYFYISEPCTGGTVVGRAIERALRVAIAVRRHLQRRGRASQPESVEAPIRPPELFDALERSGLTYEAEYLTHLPLAHRLLPDRLRLRLTLLISRPWRRRKGDIVLVEGRKEPEETPA